MNLKPIEISKQTETHAKPSYPFTLQDVDDMREFLISHGFKEEAYKGIRYTRNLLEICGRWTYKSVCGVDYVIELNTESHTEYFKSPTPFRFSFPIQYVSTDKVIHYDLIKCYPYFRNIKSDGIKGAIGFHVWDMNINHLKWAVCNRLAHEASLGKYCKAIQIKLMQEKCDDVERHEEKWKIENNAIGVDDFFEQLSRG